MKFHIISIDVFKGVTPVWTRIDSSFEENSPFYTDELTVGLEKMDILINKILNRQIIIYNHGMKSISDVPGYIQYIISETQYAFCPPWQEMSCGSAK